MTLLFLSEPSGRASCLSSTAEQNNFMCLQSLYCLRKADKNQFSREGKKATSSQLQAEEAPRFRQTGAQVTGRNLHLWGQVGQAAPHPEQSEATQASLLSGSGILLQDIQVLALLAKLLQKQEHSIPHPCAYTASDTNVLLTGTEVRTCHPDWYPAHFYQSTGRKLTENQMSGDSEG